MNISYTEYKKKVFGCFMGKSVGGTLGMPWEGDINTRKVTYYDPVPTEMVANDDLDLQVVNLETLMRTGLPVSRYHIAEIWKHHMAENAPDEYGVALSNNAIGIFAPLSGQFRNKFTAGMGGAIRSELWACLAPGNPALAAQLAKEDACTDHTDEGVYAEMFLAAVESAAFVENDIDKLIETGLEFINKDSRLYKAFSDVIQWSKNGIDIYEAREKLLKKYPSDNWTDVTINVSIILLGMLYSGGSFDKAVCGAVSLGYDTDCTGATIGSIFGILNPDDIGEKWTMPIGDKLILSSCMVNMHEPETITDFCNNIIGIVGEVLEYYNADVKIDGIDENGKVAIRKPWTKNYKLHYDWKLNEKESVISLKPCMISMVYPENVALIPERKTGYKLLLRNTSEIDLTGNVHIYTPENWTVDFDECEINLKKGDVCVLPFYITMPMPKRRILKNIINLEFVINGVELSLEASLPMSYPWLVTNLETGETSVEETSGQFFEVPEGAYSYKTTVRSAVKRQVRISAGGTRPFKVKVNGKAVFFSDGDFYAPSFHRDDVWTTIDLNQGNNEVEVIFEKSRAGEFFFGFATLYGCATWINTIERNM